MACVVKLLISNYNPVTRKIEQTPILIADNIEESQINFDTLTLYILHMSLEDRNTLADKLLSARVQQLKNSDVNKYRFVSNITIDELAKKYGIDFQLNNMDLSILNNATLVECNKMILAGHNYYGRTIDANGKEIFFILGKHGAERFINYMKTKSSILQSILNNKVINPELEIYADILEDISKEYKTPITTILLDYLNGINKYALIKGPKKKYRAFKKEQSVIEVPAILKKVISIISKEDLGVTHSSLFESLKADQVKSKNNFSMKLNKDKLYHILETYFEVSSEANLINQVPLKELFDALSDDQMIKLLHNLFIVDPELFSAHIEILKENTSAETETSKVSKKVIKEQWKLLLESKKEENIKLESYDTSLKKLSREQMTALLTEAFENYGNPVNITYYEGDYKIEETVVKEPSFLILLTFPPGLTVGDVYGENYNTDYMVSPVKLSDDPTLDEDGIYHGCYIYEFFDETSLSTHFLISRSIISPASPKKAFSSLEEAKKQIDIWNNSLIINEFGMWSSKNFKDRQRSIHTEQGNWKDGFILKNAILTVLDLYTAPINFDKFPDYFNKAFNNTVPHMKYYFLNIPGIEKILTPEQAAFFLMDFYNQIIEKERLAYNKRIEEYNKSHKDQKKERKTAVFKLFNLKDLNITEMIDKYSELGGEIIEKILLAPKVSYRIDEVKSKESLHYTEVLITHLKNNGNEVDIMGQLKDSKKKELSTKIPIHALNKLAAYLLKNYPGLKINILSYHEIEELFTKSDKLITEPISKIKGFILDGQIYINSSTATLEDLYHEVAHIFLGIMKIKDLEGYKKYIENLSKSRSFNSTLDYKSNVYKNFAYEDIVEEVAVDLFAKNMFRKQYLMDGVDVTQIDKDILSFLETLKSFLTLNQEDNTYPITSFKKEIAEKSNIELIKNNMAISYLIKTLNLLRHCN